MKQAKPTTFDHLPKTTELSEQLFDEIQRRMPALSLSPELRNSIRLAVAVYEGQIATALLFRSSVDDRKRALRISNVCNKLLKEIAKLRKNNPLITHGLLVPESFRIDDYEDILSTLKHYQTIFRQFGQSAKRGPVARKAELHRLLPNLAHLYLQNGGVTTAVSNSREKSEFIDFAWAIIKRLPVMRRPNGKLGLAEEWQDWRAKYNASADTTENRRLKRARAKR